MGSHKSHFFVVLALASDRDWGAVKDALPTGTPLEVLLDPPADDGNLGAIAKSSFKVADPATSTGTVTGLPAGRDNSAMIVVRPFPSPTEIAALEKETSGRPSSSSRERVWEPGLPISAFCGVPRVRTTVLPVRRLSDSLQAGIRRINEIVAQRKIREDFISSPPRSTYCGRTSRPGSLLK